MSFRKSKKDIVVELPPVVWNIPDNIITRFAGEVIVQVLENEFKISFFESKPEIIFGGPSKLPKEIKFDCVASIIISPNKIPGFIDVLQQQLDLYAKRKSENVPKKP